MIKAGFVGLGTMGSAMARNLLRSGVEVAVFDSDVDKLEDFWSIKNCRIASSPMDAAIDADYFFTMLPDSEVVEEVLFGENGAVLKLQEKALVVEMSTGSPMAFQDFRARLRRQHIRLIDAPVGRTPIHAKRGDLWCWWALMKKHLMKLGRFWSVSEKILCWWGLLDTQFA